MPQGSQLDQQGVQWRTQVQLPEEMQAGEERRAGHQERELPFALVRVEMRIEMEEAESARVA
jgi:hypothetical protein